MFQLSGDSPRVGPPARRGCCAERLPARTSRAAKRCLQEMERLSRKRAALLLVGQPGTDLAEWAVRIHARSGRSKGPFVTVDCRQLAPDLALLRLFGHQAGHSPLTRGRSLGTLRAAEGGTLVLDNVGELPRSIQGPLARALQCRAVRPVGSPHLKPIDLQVIATSHQPLGELTASGRLRPDLGRWFLGGKVEVPSLEESADDIPLLVDYYSRRFAARYQAPRWQPTAEQLDALCSRRWPGNDRQLAEVVERVYAFHCAAD